MKSEPLLTKLIKFIPAVSFRRLFSLLLQKSVEYFRNIKILIEIDGKKPKKLHIINYTLFCTHVLMNA
jgi:hypothetical protein